MTPITRPTHAELEAAALNYAAHGFRIVPGHEPLFDNDGNRIGCTCEEWKRSKGHERWLAQKQKEGKCKNQKHDPNFTCPTPGKHPRLTDWEAQASNDPKQIRDWWKKWPTANICFPPGINGFVTFDLDSYKKVYGDDSDLFTMADKQTATQISGGGGEHLVFQLPAGKAYTNANNTLKEQWPGVDIRCFGGQQLVEPSLHPSGNLYQWEDGYSIFDCPPKPLPPALEALLDAAHQNSAKAHAITFATPTTERPDLIRWPISKDIRELIYNPPPEGKRSEADYSICLSLVYAGATPDDILAVFQHYPIGTQGKYAESGDGYLARTIGKAQAFAELHPRPDVGATIAQLRLSIKTHNLVDHINPGPGSKKARPVADAVFDSMEADGRFQITTGKKRLGAKAGVSCNTAANALTLLNGVLFNVTPSEQGYIIELLEESRLQKFDPSLSIVKDVNKRDQKTQIDKPTYSLHKADEPFLTGTSRYMREHIQRLAQKLEIDAAQAKVDYTFAGLGEGVLLAKDTWDRIGDLTADDYAKETGIKKSLASAHLRRAEKMGLAESEREGSRGPKVYSFIPEFWQKVDELAPNLRTYGLVSRRENKRLEAAQQWCDHEIKVVVQEIKTAKATGNTAAQETAEAKKETLGKRYAKLAKQRIPHLHRLHPGLSTKDIERLAYEVAAYKRSPETAATVRTYRTQETAEHRDTVRMIRELADSFSDIDTPKEEIYKRIMEFGTFDEKLVRSVLQSPKQMRNYETLPDIRKRLAHDEFMTGVQMPPASPGHAQPALIGAA